MVPALWATPQKPVGLNTSPVSCALITGFWGCDGDMAKDRTQPIQLSSIVKTWRHSPAAGAIFRPGWRVARRKIYTRHTLSCLCVSFPLSPQSLTGVSAWGLMRLIFEVQPAAPRKRCSNRVPTDLSLYCRLAATLII